MYVKNMYEEVPQFYSCRPINFNKIQYLRYILIFQDFHLYFTTLALTRCVIVCCFEDVKISISDKCIQNSYGHFGQLPRECLVCFYQNYKAQSKNIYLQFFPFKFYWIFKVFLFMEIHKWPLHRFLQSNQKLL